MESPGGANEDFWFEILNLAAFTSKQSFVWGCQIRQETEEYQEEIKKIKTQTINRITKQNTVFFMNPKIEMLQAKRRVRHIDAVPDRTQILVLFCVPHVIKAKAEECFICAGDDVWKGGGIDHYQSEEQPSHIHVQPAKISSLTSREIRLYFTTSRHVQMPEGSLLG